MEGFIYKYYFDPIWNKTGYNLIDTLTYALIAIFAIFVLYKFLKGKIKIDEDFVKGVLAFVLLGSTLRVITDAVDNGIFTGLSPIHQMLLQSHLLDYGYFTVTPGIYVMIAGLLLASIFVLYKLKKINHLKYVGLVFWIPAIMLLVPFMNYWIYIIPVLILALIPAIIAYWYFKKNKVLSGIVAGHALDGAATFFVIDVFSKLSGKQYFEQHVLSSAIGQISGTFFTFYLIKVLLGFGAAYILSMEKMDEEDRVFIALILMIMGFAPGIRDVLRMVVGA